MVKKKKTFGSVFIGIRVENLILVYSTVDLAELHRVFVIQWRNNDVCIKCVVYSSVYNSVKYKYEAIYTQS